MVKRGSMEKRSSKSTPGDTEKNQSAIQDSEEQYRTIFNLVSDAIFLIDNETGQILEVNEAASSLYGYSRKELLSMNHRDVSAEPERTREATLKEMTVVPLRYHRKKDGTVFPVEITATHLVWKGRKSHLASIRDITGRKIIEDALRKSEETIRIIADNVPALVSYIDKNCFYRFANKRYEEWFGIPVTEIMGKHYQELLGIRAYVKIKPYVEAALSGNQASYETLLDYALGGERWVHGEYIPDIDAEGDVQGFFAMVTDITANKLAEKAIRNQEKELRSIYDHAPLIMMLVDKEWKIQKTNAFTSHFVGKTEDETINMRCGEALNCIHALDSPKGCGFGLFCRECMLRLTALNTIETGRDCKEVEITMSFSNKRQALNTIFLLSTTRLEIKGQPMALVSMQDITERKHAEERLHMLLYELEGKNKELCKAYEELKMSESMLIQSEKMASLGQLSAGIAHELKNPLSIILQGISYIQSSVKDGTLIDACDRIKKSAIRADIVIQSLLSFSRQAPPSFTEDDINALIEEALTMVEHQMNLRNIEVIRNYFLHIPKVRVDSNQIREVFINTLINAADAMKDGGTITLTTTEGTDRDGEPCVRAVITDTGTGIPGEILKKVFDPFFTTKTDSGGTGLGLSVTKGIVERHHGSIAISSEEGKGTTVTITLPCNPFEKESHYNG